MVAYEMNGADLPWLNGYPARLVVPGFYGTYWVKHLSEISVIDSPFDGFWMKTAYRIPDNACACMAVGEKAAATVPINGLDVRSFITSIADGATVRAQANLMVKGIAFDWRPGRPVFEQWRQRLDRGDARAGPRALSENGGQWSGWTPANVC